MNFAAPPPWAAEATPRAQHSLADLAGAAVPFPGVPWAPASRKAPVNFLPAWQELQLQNQLSQTESPPRADEISEEASGTTELRLGLSR